MSTTPGLNWNRPRRKAPAISGGHLQVPKTFAGRIMLAVTQRKLKRDFYRRQEGR